MSRKLRDMVLVASQEGSYFADRTYKAFEKVLKEKKKEYDGMPSGTDLYGWSPDQRRDEIENALRHFGSAIPVDVDYTRFASDEITPQIKESVRGRDVYFFHSFMNDDQHDPFRGPILLYLMNSALSDAQASQIINVLPYYPWQRQDRKERGRVPISAKLIPDLTRDLATGTIIMDLHSDQQQGFFARSPDHLYGMPLFVGYYDHLRREEDLVVVAPDVGAARRARGLAKRLGKGDTDVAIIDKRRSSATAHDVVTYNIIGEDLIPGKRVILVDDMIDTGDTTIAAAERLKEAGATYVSACATHGLFSPKDGVPAEKRLCDSQYIDEVVITDTIPPRQSFTEYEGKLVVLSAAELFARAIYETQIGGSISTLLAEDRPPPKPVRIQ